VSESRSVSSSRNKRTSPSVFYRQVVAELRKVVWPTRNQLTSYTTVVIFFVAIMIALVTVIDYGLNHAAKYVFG
jgi:preprotein translocase subunit SecE